MPRRGRPQVEAWHIPSKGRQTAPMRVAFDLNNRNFAVDPAAVCARDTVKTPECAAVGDIEPEALRFIPAEQSPNGRALLVATHEQTDSVTLIQLDPK